MANTDVTRIAGNIGAMNALNALQNINKQLSIHQSRLQTGKRINSAADDPAGYTIATKMLARSEGLKTSLDNISDASNMLSVAEGGLSKMNDILVQMRSKAEQAASDTLGTSERDAIATQLSSYAEQIDNIVAETKWNGTQLLDGSVSKQFQTGVDAGEVTKWQLSQAHDASALGISTIASNDTITSQLGMGSMAQVTTSAKFGDMGNLTSGSYSLAVKDVAAADGTTGKLTQTGVFSGTAGLSLVATSTDDAAVTGGIGLAGLSNGTHTMSITSYTSGVSGASFGTMSGTIDAGTANAVTFTNLAMGTNATVNNDAIALGGGLSLKLGTIATGATASGTVTFDYVQKNTVKMALQRADGSAVSVDANGIDGAPTANARSSAFYVKAAAGATGTYDTGVGVKVTAGTDIAAFTAGANIGTFGFQAKSNYAVDVSTASKASDYMATVNTAMDTVNKSMSSLGSLMARLDFKSDAISNAQVNVEASYNRIMNANMAEEQMNASKYSILQQTATAMLAQANQAPQSLLSLFR